MEWMEYRFCLEIQYEKKVSDEYFQLRCLPRNDGVQKTLNLKEEFEPENCMAKKRTDSEKNHYILGYIANPHDCFRYCAQGLVEVNFENRKPEPQEMLYRISSTYTEVGPTLGEWYGQMNLPEGEVQERALWIANFVRRKLGKMESAEYDLPTTEAISNASDSVSHLFAEEKATECGTVTDGTAAEYGTAMDGTIAEETAPGAVNTVSHLLTAEQTAERGYGDCRDYAQIMIALCHMDGITARYAMGMLPGKTELHAWVEVQGEDGIYYGLDPMNGCPVTEGYITLCHGRDAKECSLTMSGSDRGVIRHVKVSAETTFSEKPEYSLMPENSNTHWLAQRMALRNSSFRSIPLDRLNSIMNNLEFTILSAMRERAQSEGMNGRLYIRDVASWLNVPAARLSPIFTKLEEEGFVHWDHDPQEGASFVELTDYGQKRLEEQQNIMIRFYEQIITRFGREKARELDKLMLELESILRDELELVGNGKDRDKNE